MPLSAAEGKRFSAVAQASEMMLVDTCLRASRRSGVADADSALNSERSGRLLEPETAEEGRWRGEERRRGEVRLEEEGRRCEEGRPGEEGRRRRGDESETSLARMLSSSCSS